MARRSPPKSNRSDSGASRNSRASRASRASVGSYKHEAVDDARNVRWSKAEEVALIQFLIDYGEKAADGSFKNTAIVWTDAAEHLRSLWKGGSVKTDDKCKAKWGRVCTGHY